MKRYFIRFSYLGTRYRGLQRQNANRATYDADTIQGALECALSAIQPNPINKPYLTLSSRTDVGVHALDNTGHVDLRHESDDDALYDANKMLEQINFYLNYCRHEIRVQEVIPMSSEFHCRREALSRTYVYKFMKSIKPTNSTPLIDSIFNFRLRSQKFDLEKANSAAKLFQGLRDFRTFCGEELPPYKKPLRVLDVSEIERSQSITPYDPYTQNFEYFQIKFQSKGFLYNQIRRMTGAIVAHACDIISEKDIKVMLQVPSRANWDPRVKTLPPHGLQLVNVKYDPQSIQRYRLN